MGEELSSLKCEKGITLKILKGDITELTCDAIVNPANSLMMMGGGVAGAIRRKAGETVEKEARKRAPVPIGRAIITSSGNLHPRIKYIIHAPTMERPAMRTTKEKVKKATLAALNKAKEEKIRCIALPAMGAGVGGLSIQESLEAMIEALEEYISKQEDGQPIEIIQIVAYGETASKQFLEALKRVKLTKCKT